MQWRRVCFRNTRILLASNASHTYTTRIFHKIIFHKVWKGWSKLQGHSRASLHRMRCERHTLFWCYTWSVRSACRYFPYKCSTKSSFMWFGMQWTYIFKIWTSLTEGCFQFQMLTCALFVKTARARGCARLRVSGLMYLRLKMVLWCKINVNTASYVLRD